MSVGTWLKSPEAKESLGCRAKNDSSKIGPQLPCGPVGGENPKFAPGGRAARISSKGLPRMQARTSSAVSHPSSAANTSPCCSAASSVGQGRSHEPLIMIAFEKRPALTEEAT